MGCLLLLDSMMLCLSKINVCMSDISLIIPFPVRFSFAWTTVLFNKDNVHEYKAAPTWQKSLSFSFLFTSARISSMYVSCFESGVVHFVTFGSPSLALRQAEFLSYFLFSLRKYRTLHHVMFFHEVSKVVLREHLRSMLLCDIEYVR